VYLGFELMAVSSVDVQKTPNYLYPDGTSAITISVVGMNRCGTITPFRNLEVEFLIEEGKEKVDIIRKESNKMILRAKYEIGNVVVVIKNKYTIIPIRIEIPIVTPTA
jgi:hypothetical protein